GFSVVVICGPSRGKKPPRQRGNDKKALTKDGVPTDVLDGCVSGISNLVFLPTEKPLPQEVQRDTHKLVGLFYIASMPTLLDYNKVRRRKGLLIEGAALHRDDLVLPPPDEARGGRDAGEQVRQAGVVHIRLPG